MKKLPLAAALVLLFTAVTPQLRAQSASFVYTGVPTSPLHAGDDFTVGVSVLFTAGGSVANLTGVSYWMTQVAPTAAFPFTITNRNNAGSQFTDLQSPALAYPQTLDAINRNSNGTTSMTDLGALIALASTPLGNGLYFVANLTFHVGANAANGDYLFANTTSSTPNVGGRISVITGSTGATAPITSSQLRISVVPDSGSTILSLVAGLLPLALIRRVRAAAVR